MVLASVVVSHINRALPSPDSAVTHQTIFHLVGIVYIVASETVTGHRDLALRDALLSHGIITALTTVCRALSRSTLPIVEIELRGLLSALVDHLCSFPRHRWITESLRAGLLHAVFTCATGPHLEEIWTSLEDILRDILPASTVYHSVLLQLRVSFAEMRDRDDAATFSDAGLFKLWESFVGLVDMRLRVADEYHAGTLTSMKACENLKCAKICHKHELKRCSGCLITFYCSRVCQTNDWRHGGHRQTCGDLSVRRKQVAEYSHVCVSDRSFLRALVHHEYTTRWEEIARLHLSFMHKNAGEVPYTIFHFTAGSCEIEFGALEDLGSDFDHDVERAATSDGIRQLHLMEVLDGDQEESRTWPFPLRLTSPEFVQGLRAIAETLPQGSTSDELEEFSTRIWDLINLKVQVTH
ncbi:hypothetical protein B0H19DRAFT_1228164 [Mycena capillaripes]|nr:hypothetical protein B0H19DRAFT_1228164 [Mycena capillaripes]